MRLNYFNFKKLGDQILMTNDFGKYIFVSLHDLKKIVSGQVEEGSSLYSQLLEAQMIFDDTALEYTNQNRYHLREYKNHVNTSTSLHIFVVTTACNMNCVYCQANNGKEKPHLYMDKVTAERAVEIALQSPAISLDFEFQGGEPLLNFDLIKYMVEYTEEKKGIHEIRYNVVTNLTLLTDDMIDFFKTHRIGISTSIDGSEYLHNQNRKFPNGEGTFQKVRDSVQRLRDAGIYVGAIETTTKYNLEYPEELVQAYVDMGFDRIFIRPLTPLGKASVNWNEIGYTSEQFIDFYRRAVEKMIQINKSGCFIKEAHAEILLQRILGRFVNYMELRSPCGAGIGQLAYYSDGNIFTCDEGRMLFEMGDDTFQLGNVMTSTYSDVINNNTCKTVCASSMLETIPTCCDCVYQPYCGTCPVVNYAQKADVIEKQPRGYRCKIYGGILDFLFGKFQENDIETINILKSWSN